MNKIIAMVFCLALLPTVAFAAEIDDYISEWQKFFKDYEDEKISYMEAWLDLYDLRHKKAIITKEDMERLGMDFARSHTNEIGRASMDGEMFKNIICTENAWEKDVFKGKKGIFARLTAAISTCEKIRDDDSVNVKTEYSAYVSTYSLIGSEEITYIVGDNYTVEKTPESTERTPRKLVEQSFPGFAKIICDRNIMNINRLQMLLSYIKSATTSTLTLYPDYNFNLINDSYFADDNFKECKISIFERLENKVIYKCEPKLGPVGYKDYKTSDCSEEVTAKIPAPKMYVKIKLKKSWIESAFEKAWEKFKYEAYNFSPVKFEPQMAEEMKKAVAKQNYTIGIKVYNDTASFFEMTNYLTGEGLIDIKPYFLKDSDVRIKIKSDAMYNIYSKHWVIDMNIPEPIEQQFKRIFLGGIGTIIEIFKAGILGDIAVEPFWEVDKLRESLGKTVSFQTCAEEFFEKAEQNKTTEREFSKCFDILK